MEEVRARGLDDADRGAARRPASRSSASASACSCSSTPASSSAAPPASDCSPAGSPASTPTASRSLTSAGRRCAGSSESRLVEGIESETPFYFVHSFAPGPGAEDLLGSAAYGARFACAAERENVFGVQFHPEKSSAAGLRLLSNFAGICAAVPA